MIPSELKNRIHNALDKCVKLIKNPPPYVLSLENMITLENCKFGYKLANKLLPKEIVACALTDHKGKSLQKQHSYNTRNRLIPNLPSVKCSRYLKSIYCMGYKEYVLLSSDIKNSKTLQSFVRKCKLKLLD